jgi:insertion element IS1 protein InsB
MPTVIVHKVVEAEADEMWSFVGRKRGQRWLWGALDQQTGRIVASVFGRREDCALLALKRLLAPFGIRRFYTDGGGTYRRQRRTHRRERKHLTLRIRIKRLVRKTICFSRSVHLHILSLGCSSTALTSAWLSTPGSSTEVVHHRFP